MQATDKRKSNIELLRIVVMFLIVGHHYFIHGLVDSWDQEGCQIWLRGGGKSTDLSQACFFQAEKLALPFSSSLWDFSAFGRTRSGRQG